MPPKKTTKKTTKPKGQGDSKKPAKKKTTKKTTGVAKRTVLGRPHSYEPDRHPKVVASLAAQGYTDEEMASLIGISHDTFYRWCNEHKEFSEAKKRAKREIDLEIENSLFKRAKGYNHPEEKIFYDSRNGKVVRAETEKHIPPDPTSMIFWLKNRQPELWRDRQEHKVAGNIAVNGIIEHTFLPAERDRINEQLAGLIQDANLEKDVTPPKSK